MTERNLKTELQYYHYNDPEYGEDIENIDYESLIGLLEELIDKNQELQDRVRNLEELVISMDKMMSFKGAF